ncbi:MAG: hypothetical protein FJ265_23110 [Planctomycetes bacterium]|nr:hypothetical protein [Planctomycetota bacterium]
MNQMELAREKYPHLIDSVALYRLRNPRSRATSDWTTYGSGSHVRRAICIYCGTTIATCSAKWPATRTFLDAAAEHSAYCASRYVKRNGRSDLTLRMVLDLAVNPLPSLVAKDEARRQRREAATVAAAQRLWCDEATSPAGWRAPEEMEL